jgi:LacI family transcriptional regulator
MNDVANLAGVSLATVSRVVSGNGDVRPDLAERVRDAVDVLGYRRDLMASNLRRSDRVSATIGLIIEDVANPFFSAVHRGVEDVAREHGVITFAGSSDEEPARERELADAFGARGVDGLVIVPCSSDQGYLQTERPLRSGGAGTSRRSPPPAWWWMTPSSVSASRRAAPRRWPRGSS